MLKVTVYEPSVDFQTKEPKDKELIVGVSSTGYYVHGRRPAAGFTALSQRKDPKHEGFIEFKMPYDQPSVSYNSKWLEIKEIRDKVKPKSLF